MTPTKLIRHLLEVRTADRDSSVWIHLAAPEQVLGQAERVEQRREAAESLPLYGVPFAVKDNIDVAGYPTTAGCLAFTYSPSCSASVVDRLLEAGAIFVGKTNLDQFATGLAGDRSPYGICRNLFDPAYIAGGSSSGSAVAVASGWVSFALGTDTAGSGRIPAGCNNIVGLKPTPGLVSTEGVVPACPSLDCVSLLALAVSDAHAVLDTILQGDWPGCEGRPNGSEFVYAIPRKDDLEFFGDHAQEVGFQQALTRLEQSGGRRIEINFGAFREAAGLLYEGPWLAERFAGLSGFLKEHRSEVYPETRAIIEGGARHSAADFFQALARLRTLRATCLRVFEQADVLVVPTLPVLPRLAAVLADSRGWSRRLGYYTNFVNLLGMAALSVPAGFTGQGLPTGITLIGPGGSDRRLCEWGMAWQRELDLPLGATDWKLPKAEPRANTFRVSAPPAGFVRVAVAGAHRQGQPLYPDLCRWGGSLCAHLPYSPVVSLLCSDGFESPAARFTAG